MRERDTHTHTHTHRVVIFLCNLGLTMAEEEVLSVVYSIRRQKRLEGLRALLQLEIPSIRTVS